MPSARNASIYALYSTRDPALRMTQRELALQFGLSVTRINQIIKTMKQLDRVPVKLDLDGPAGTIHERIHVAEALVLVKTRELKDAVDELILLHAEFDAAIRGHNGSATLPELSTETRYSAMGG